MLPLLCEARVKLAISFEGCCSTDLIAGAQLADTRFEEVFLNRPAHQVVVDRGLCDLLVEADGVVVVFSIKCNEIGGFEPEFVGECLF
jgi:hypothetical protein